MTDGSAVATNRGAGGGPLVGRLRQGLLIVAAVTIIGTAVELALQRHWTQLVQLVAWLALALLAVAVVLARRPEDAKAVRWARGIAIVVCLLAVVGVIEHVLGNYDAGELDAVYGEQWPTLSVPFKLWLSITQTVGPSPALLPGVLVVASLCVWFATISGEPVPS